MEFGRELVCDLLARAGQRIWNLAFSERELSYTLSPVRLSSVTFVHPTQPVEIFGNFSTPFGNWYRPTLAIHDTHGTLYEDRPS